MKIRRQVYVDDFGSEVVEFCASDDAETKCFPTKRQAEEWLKERHPDEPSPSPGF